MHQQILAMTQALATDEIWLAWCRDNLGGMPNVAYEPELSKEGIPDESYPFVFLYNAKVTGPASFTIELACGILDETGQTTDTITATVHGATVSVSREYCSGLLSALAMYVQAVACVYRAKLGNVDAEGETGSAVLHPFYEAWGKISAQWTQSTRKPLGR